MVSSYFQQNVLSNIKQNLKNQKAKIVAILNFCFCYHANSG